MPQRRSSAAHARKSSTPNSKSHPSPRKHSHARSSHLASHSLLSDRYQILHQLGHGLMGTVFRAIDTVDSSHVAIKVVLKKSVHGYLERISLRREVLLLKQISHNHIVSFKNAFQDHNAVYIVTEFCENGDLFHYLNKHPNPIPELEALKYMRQLMQALKYLNANGISHRDIKPENILLSDDGNIKLADFGLCFYHPPNATWHAHRPCGTPQYSAPEIFDRSAYLPERSDMWSCGILLVALLTQRLPFNGKHLHQVEHQVMRFDIHHLLNSSSLRHVSNKCKSLIAALLSISPFERPLPTKALRLIEDAMLGPNSVSAKQVPW